MAGASPDNRPTSGRADREKARPGHGRTRHAGPRPKCDGRPPPKGDGRPADASPTRPCSMPEAHLVDEGSKQGQKHQRAKDGADIHQTHVRLLGGCPQVADGRLPSSAGFASGDLVRRPGPGRADGGSGSRRSGACPRGGRPVTTETRGRWLQTLSKPGPFRLFPTVTFRRPVVRSPNDIPNLAVGHKARVRPARPADKPFLGNKSQTKSVTSLVHSYS